MQTNKRLTEAYKKAFPVPFDKDSKFVFFGDTHRGDDSIADEFGRNRPIYYHALNHYYQNGFTYVELGDGDELIEHRHFRHIYNAHVPTFRMLRKFFNDNRMLRIYGNHDNQLKKPEYVRANLYQVPDDYLDESVPLFPGLEIHEALLFTNRETEQELFIVHGHQGDPLNDQFSFLPFFGIRVFWSLFHRLGMKYAATPAKSREKRHKVEKRYNKWNKDHGIIIICGHTHRPRFPKPGESSYFNVGCCIHPRGLSCLELTDNCLTLVLWRIHTHPDGSMFIKRTVVAGPEPIENFQMDPETLTE
ncbi:MAG: metallophosphoesterase family protein [Firmicutes bacterium]|nr:metallophosphoesterase family protein [Bacillota bacterium]